MPKHQLLKGLEISFKNWQNVNVYYLYIQLQLPLPPELALGLYTCEYADIYRGDLTHASITYISLSITAYCHFYWHRASRAKSKTILSAISNMCLLCMSHKHDSGH